MTHRRALALVFAATLALLAAACFDDGGSGEPEATPTPSLPGPTDAIAEWVANNRSVEFIPNCDDARPGLDVGKLCARLKGERGPRRAYDLGPTFSDPTALALVEDSPQGWRIISVTNIDPSKPQLPGIDWPLESGDAVLVIGLGENDCLSIRKEPTQQAERLNCMPDGTKAIVQEGPVEAETFTWWRIAGDGFNGWAAGAWLRLEDEIARALQPQPTSTPSP
jgi:hypothetical protein